LSVGGGLAGLIDLTEEREGSIVSTSLLLSPSPRERMRKKPKRDLRKETITSVAHGIGNAFGIGNTLVKLATVLR
jgi:hypothetical protein